MCCIHLCNFRWDIIDVWCQFAIFNIADLSTLVQNGAELLWRQSMPRCAFDPCISLHRAKGSFGKICKIKPWVTERQIQHSRRHYTQVYIMRILNTAHSKKYASIPTQADISMNLLCLLQALYMRVKLPRWSGREAGNDHHNDNRCHHQQHQ